MAARATLPHVSVTRHLPLAPATGAPTVDAMRRRLGGRASTDETAGSLVIVEADGGVALPGVVVFADGDEAHVMSAANAVRRVARAALHPLHDAPPALVDLAGAVRAFARLREGAPVRFSHPASGELSGTLVEKCRYGALVLREDETLVGVGFRQVRAEGVS